MPVDRVAGDEQVPPGPVAQGVHRLADVARYVAAGVHDRVPAARAQRRIVTGVPVAGQPRHAREQIGPGPAAAEQGHLGPGPQSILNDRAAHERRTAQNQNPHSPEPYPPAVRGLIRRAPAQQH